MPERIPVLYVAGSSRSGSTLVANAIATTPGVVSVGEVRHIWTRGIGENWRCGCGSAFEQCEFWNEVLSEAFGRPPRIDIDRLRSSERQLLRLRTSWRALDWTRNPARIQSRHGHYLEALERLYPAIASVADAEAIVDSSKTPTYAAVLSLLHHLDLRVLHLTRDPRAAAYSFLNPKPSPDRGPSESMDRLGTSKSSFLWAWWNGLADRLWQGRPNVLMARIRYEALTREPEETLRYLRAVLLPEVSDRIWGVAGRTVNLGVSHTVSGNPDRLKEGPVVIEPDDRWQAGLSARQQALVVAIAGRMMHRYGYGPEPG